MIRVFFEVFVLKGSQWFALFIIAFMAFSTIAFVLSAAFNSNGSSGTPDNNSSTNLTKLTFTAQVDANVVEVFPSFKLAAETKEYNIAKIDSAIAQAGGITKVASLFRQSPSSDGASVATYYIADISFDAAKTNFDAVTAAIGEKTSSLLGQTGFFPNALIAVPNKIKLENTDLNISKDYEFKDTVIQAYLNSGTMKGDNILARVEIAFSGEQPLTVFSSEISNVSSQTAQHAVSLALPLASLEQKLTFTADANYSGWIDENNLKNALLNISDVNSLEKFSVEPIYYTLLLAVKEPFEPNLESDLNAALPAIANLTSVDFYPDANVLNVLIGFEENSDIKTMETAVAAKLSDFHVAQENFSFTEPTVSVSGNILLSGSADAKKAADSSMQLFASKKFSAKVYQLGYLAVSSLTDPDTKQTFAVDSNSVEAALFPVHKAGDQIFASVIFYSQRATLLSAQAIEAINPVRIS